MWGKNNFISFFVGLLMVVLLVGSCDKKSPESSTAAPDQQPQDQTTPQIDDSTREPSEEKSAEVFAPLSDKAPGKVAPLKIELPKPVFVGTPQNFRVERLEKPRSGPRAPFLAPAGTTNVARGKNVTSSYQEPIIGQLDWITDGDKEATEGSFVELGPGLQSVTIDLGADYEIYAVLFWHFHAWASVYFDVVVQIADEPEFTKNVITIFNNDHDNSSGLGVGSDLHYVETYEGKLIDAKGQQRRYVRLYSQGGSAGGLNHYIEVEVYGRPRR